ncbi:MAG: glycosyltransferase family 9 protein [bacterium]|nr:glycosyltransferase family 9 protein [bacterium]
MAQSSIKITSPSPSILIILMGSLGDVARGLCLVDHIKTNLPRSRVTWLVEPKWSGLVRLNQQVDRMIIFKRAWRLSAVWGLFKDLRRDHFDITLDLQRILKSGFFSLLAGAERRIGFHRRNAKELNWIFNNEHIGYFSDKLPKICHYLKFTEYLGLPEPENLEFGLSSLNPSEMAPEIIAEINQPFIVVVLGTSWESKNWNDEGYVGLIQRILADQTLKVVLVGDSSRATLAATLTEKFQTTAVINLVGQTSLVQLAALLKAAAAGVGPDSGPGHVAAAVKTPFVTLFGPTSPQRTAPFGNDQLVVDAGLNCAPCYKNRCADRNKQCMNSIHPDAVMEKVTLALSEHAPLR